MKKILITFLALSLLCVGFLSAAEDPFVLRGIRSLGMGGAGVANSDDQNAFFYNPAAVTDRKNAMFTVFEVQAAASQDVIDFYKWINEDGETGKISDDLKNFNDLSQGQKDKILAKIDSDISKLNCHIVLSAPNLSYISGPLGESGKTFLGIGVFDKFDVRLRLNSGFLIPSIDILGQADAAGMLLLARKINEKLSVGVNGKMLMRGSINEERLSVLAFDGFEPLLQPGMGMGADLGATYKLQDNLKLGVSLSDVGGTNIHYDKVTEDREQDDGSIKTVTKEERDSIIYQRLNVGVSYKPLNAWFNNPWIPDTTLAVDFRDLTDAAGNHKIDDMSELLKKSHMGAEVAWKFINGRIGLNSGYPSFGLGFYLWALKFDYAYYIDELGMYPGDRPEANHTIAITWRFGTTLKRDRK